MTHIIEQLWGDQPGDWCCLSTKEPGYSPRDYWFDPDDCDVEDFIERHLDLSIYFCPHLFAKRHRKKENAVLPRLLYADLDAVNPRGIDLKPTIAITSSPGRFVGLWVTDRAASNELNKRMTRYTGADKSNWKLTQLLRVPGGINHKYPDKPRVRLMWNDGPKYKVRDLEAKLPQLSASINPPRGDRRASRLTEEQIFAKYKLGSVLEHNLRSDTDFARRQRKTNEWLNRQAASSRELHHVQRWRFFWRLACDLRDKGVSPSESFVLLRDCCWNKYSGDDQVWKIVEKVYCE
jgi:hypothetical protein